MKWEHTAPGTHFIQIQLFPSTTVTEAQKQNLHLGRILYKRQKSLLVEKRGAWGESWDTWGNGEKLSQEETEIILKTTRMLENLEVTRKYTYNIKSEKEQVTPLRRQDSQHRACWPDGQIVRRKWAHLRVSLHLQHKCPWCFHQKTHILLNPDVQSSTFLLQADISESLVYFLRWIHGVANQSRQI